MNKNKWYTVVGLTVLVGVTTYLIRMPLPGGGYFNFGDVAVVFAGLVLGKWGGAIAGGVGSAAADIIGGWFTFAPLTFVAKGLEGFITGFASGKPKAFTLLFPALGALAMVATYFVGEIIMPTMGLAAAITEIIPNLIQAVGAVVGGRLLYGLAELTVLKPAEDVA